MADHALVQVVKRSEDALLCVSLGPWQAKAVRGSPRTSTGNRIMLTLARLARGKAAGVGLPEGSRGTGKTEDESVWTGQTRLRPRTPEPVS